MGFTPKQLRVLAPLKGQQLTHMKRQFDMQNWQAKQGKKGGGQNNQQRQKPPPKQQKKQPQGQKRPQKQRGGGRLAVLGRNAFSGFNNDHVPLDEATDAYGVFTLQNSVITSPFTAGSIYVIGLCQNGVNIGAAQTPSLYSICLQMALQTRPPATYARRSPA